jgi:hypothetical protein
MEKKTDMENFSGTMVLHMKEILKIIVLVEKEHIFLGIKENILELGLIIN